MLVLLPLCRHLEPISLLAQGFCWCSLEVVLGMAAGSLQLPLHSSELQGSQWNVGPKIVPSLVPAGRAGAPQPQTSFYAGLVWQVPGATLGGARVSSPFLFKVCFYQFFKH